MNLIVLMLFFTTSFSSSFYEAFESKSLSQIELTLAELEISTQKDATTLLAYKGALLTKKASFAKTPMQKLKLFREGAATLNQAIEKSPNNAEFRFLRLVIQENAPAILGYNKNKTEDAVVVIKYYDSLPVTLRNYIKKYTAQSKILKSSDL